MIRQTAVLPIVTSYSAVTAVINACEGGQHWHQALGLLVAMQQFAVLANVIYYHAAIHLYMYIYSVLARWASSGSRPWVRGGDAATSGCAAQWLISACGKVQQGQRASRLLALMSWLLFCPKSFICIQCL